MIAAALFRFGATGALCACTIGAVAATYPGDPGGANAPVVVPDAVPARPQVAALEALVQAMQTAAQKADEPAYLRCIDDSSPVFHTEQRAWVRDLARSAPERLTFEIEGVGTTTTPDGAVAPPGDDALVARVTIRWQMPGGKARSFPHDAWFVRRADRWLYAGEAWPTIVVPPEPQHGQYGVTVRYSPGADEAAREVARLMPGIRARVDRVFAAPLRAPQEVKLYTSMSHLQASIYPSYANPLGGWNEPGESIKILAAPSMRGRALENTLSHEYGHAVSFECGPKINDAPWWVLEGIAEVAAGAMNPLSGTGPTLARDTRVLDLAVRGDLRPWDELADFYSVPSKLHGQVYAQGRSMMDFIGRAYGHDARVEFLACLGRGDALDDSARAALGVPFAEVHVRWLHWVMQRCAARFADRLADVAKRDATPDPLALPSPDEP